jgi:hypothetical protein
MDRIKKRLARLVASGALTPEAAEYIEGSVIGRLYHVRFLMNEQRVYSHEA